MVSKDYLSLSTTLNAIIKIFENRNLKIELAAPTGRAAKRMTELTGKSSATIHRLLESEWDEKNGKQFFCKNLKNQLDCDVLIVDEMSMVDVQLFKALLEASKLTTRIILVGDSDQLPSVGAGNVLIDLTRIYTAAYLFILTENTSERASAKEYRTRTARARYGRLLPHMKHCFCHAHIRDRQAISDLSTASVHTALSWAELTALVHFISHFTDLFIICYVKYSTKSPQSQLFAL